MGRYYHGDIEGKFWFAVQSSVSAERFGQSYIEPNYVTFDFSSDDLDSINAEIKKIEDDLGEYKQKLEDFFKEKSGWNDKMLEDAGITKKHLEDYADLELGIKIRDCVVSQGSCTFDAEL
jgi:hypothetical protein